MYNNLGKGIIRWKQLNEHIIIGLDNNEDVRLGQTKQIFQVTQYEKITINKIAPPVIYNRKNSRELINGIFVTKAIELHQAGYFLFGNGGDSDHRDLWTDIVYYAEKWGD